MSYLQNLTFKFGEKIIISPLNWGMGHATRIVPIIRILEEKGADIYIACDGRTYAFLSAELPDCNFIRFYSPEIKLARNIPLKIFLSIPYFLFITIKEYFFLQKQIKKLGISIVISDNRYGFRSKLCRNVIITHQLYPKIPGKLFFLQKILNKFIYRLLSPFDEVWIPDFAGPNNISGELSHPANHKLNLKYIGILSRFQVTRDIVLPDLYEVVIIFSGTEPQRSVFERKIMQEIHLIDKKTLILTGKPQEKRIDRPNDNVTIYGHLDSSSLKYYMRKSDLIICRSGYSSIMDIFYLGRKAVLVPTPGQTEQEYLSEYLRKKWDFTVVEQSNLSVKQLIENVGINC